MDETLAAREKRRLGGFRQGVLVSARSTVRVVGVLVGGSGVGQMRAGSLTTALLPAGGDVGSSMGDLVLGRPSMYPCAP